MYYIFIFEYLLVFWVWLKKIYVEKIIIKKYELKLDFNDLCNFV